MISPIRFDNYYFALILSFLLIVFMTYKKGGILLTVALVYATLSALHIAIYPHHPYDQLNNYSQMALIIISLYAFKNIILFFIFCFVIDRKYVASFLVVFYLIALVSSAVVFYRFFTQAAIPYGLVLNASSEGNFLGVMTPIALFIDYKKLNYFKFMIPAAAIMTTSSMGIGCVVLTIFVYAIYFKKYKLFAGVFIVSLMSYSYVGENLFSTSGRLKYWKWFMLRWYENCDHWLGTGAGTFSAFGKWLQKVYDFIPDNVFFPTMHSDFLQVVFEYGYIGGILFLLLLIQVIYLSLKSKKIWLICAVFNFSIVSFLNMPWHYNMTALLGCLLLRLVYEQRDRDGINNMRMDRANSFDGDFFQGIKLVDK